MISRIGNYKNSLGARVFGTKTGASLGGKIGGQVPTYVPKMGPGGPKMEDMSKVGGQK